MDSIRHRQANLPESEQCNCLNNQLKPQEYCRLLTQIYLVYQNQMKVCCISFLCQDNWGQRNKYPKRP